MMILFTTMMYGTAMPILFFIALFSFGVQYYLDIIMLYYVYAAPPTYDESLNFAMVENISYLPLVLLSFGFW